MSSPDPPPDERPVACSQWQADTSDAALKVWIDAQRRLTPSQKLEQLFTMIEAGMRMREDAVRRLYPTADDCEVFLRAAALSLGRETAESVYGPIPADPPSPREP